MRLKGLRMVQVRVEGFRNHGRFRDWDLGTAVKGFGIRV